MSVDPSPDFNVTRDEIESFLDASLKFVPSMPGKDIPDQSQIRNNCAQWITEYWPEWMKTLLVSAPAQFAIGDKESIFGKKNYAGLFFTGRGMNLTSTDSAKILANDVPLPLSILAHEEGHRLDDLLSISTKDDIIQAVQDEIDYQNSIYADLSVPHKVRYGGERLLLDHLKVNDPRHPDAYAPDEYAAEGVAELISHYLLIRTQVRPLLPTEPIGDEALDKLIQRREANIERMMQEDYPYLWPVFRGYLPSVERIGDDLALFRSEAAQDFADKIQTIAPDATEPLVRQTYAYYGGLIESKADMLAQPEVAAECMQFLKRTGPRITLPTLQPLIDRILPYVHFSEMEMQMISEIDFNYKPVHGVPAFDRLMHLSSTIHQFAAIRDQYNTIYRALGQRPGPGEMINHIMGHMQHPCVLHHVTDVTPTINALLDAESQLTRDVLKDIQNKTAASATDMANLVFEAFHQTIPNSAYVHLVERHKLFSGLGTFESEIFQWSQNLDVSLDKRYQQQLAQRLDRQPTLTDLYLDFGGEEIAFFEVQMQHLPKTPTTQVDKPGSTDKLKSQDQRSKE